MALEKPAGGIDDSPLLAVGHAVRAAAVAIVFPVSNLGKHQRISVLHDQIDFTTAGVVISRQRLQTATVQKRLRNLLPVTAPLARGRHLVSVGCLSGRNSQ